MLECLTTSTANTAFNNEVIYINQTILAPAKRYAVNSNKLQILPGLAVPIAFNENSKTKTGGFLYLSFEQEF